MARMEAELDIEEGRALVRLGGALDVSTAHRLGALLRRLIHEGCTRIVVDVSATSTIDASGIGILRGADRSLRRRCGGRLEFRDATPHLASLLAESGLADEAEAIPLRAEPSSGGGRQPRHPGASRSALRQQRPRVHGR